MTPMNTAEIRRTIEAAQRLVVNLSEALAYRTIGDYDRLNLCIESAESNHETIGIYMGRKVLDREPEAA
jgi:hypothetical protein